MNSAEFDPGQVFSGAVRSATTWNNHVITLSVLLTGVCTQSATPSLTHTSVTAAATSVRRRVMLQSSPAPSPFAAGNKTLRLQVRTYGHRPDPRQRFYLLLLTLAVPHWRKPVAGVGRRAVVDAAGRDADHRADHDAPTLCIRFQ